MNDSLCLSRLDFREGMSGLRNACTDLVYRFYFLYMLPIA